MTDYEMEQAERAEVMTGIKNTANLLLTTALQLNNLLVDSGDIGEISYDAYATLVGMMQELDKNYALDNMLQDVKEGGAYQVTE